MSPELTVLTLAALWQMLQFVLFAVPANRDLGTGYTMSPRDREPRREMTTRTARLQRAFMNHSEWLLPFAIAVGVIEFTGQNSTFTATCAWIFLAARLLYLPAYVYGLVPWRSLIWAVGFLATTFMLLAALL